jgi:hypothetical protein
MTVDYDGQGYVALAIGLQQSPSVLKQYAANYPGVVVLNDAALSAWNLYNISGYIPLNYVVDPTDTVRYGAVGWNEAAIRAVVEQYLTGVSETHVQPLEFTSIGANPVVRHSAVRFSLPKAANVTLRVYSTSGALVRTLVNGQMPAGANTVNWNLQDNAGRPVADGLYLYELNTGSQVAQAKVSVLK